MAHGILKFHEKKNVGWNANKVLSKQFKQQIFENGLFFRYLIPSRFLFSQNRLVEANSSNSAVFGMQHKKRDFFFLKFQMELERSIGCFKNNNINYYIKIKHEINVKDYLLFLKCKINTHKIEICASVRLN